MLDDRLKLLVDLVGIMDRKVIKGGKTDPDFHRMLAAMRMAIDYFAYEMDEKSKKLSKALRAKDSIETARKSAMEENKKLIEKVQKLSRQVAESRAITPCNKSKPDPKTPQDWLSMPMRHFPVSKQQFGSRLKRALEFELREKCRQEQRSLQLGDALLFDANKLKGYPNIGKISIQQLTNWQAKWRQEFGDDYEKELKIWEAS